MEALKNMLVENGEAVAAEQIAVAVTAGRLRYDDGATQVFEIGAPPHHQAERDAR